MLVNHDSEAFFCVLKDDLAGSLVKMENCLNPGVKYLNVVCSSGLKEP